MSDSISDSVDMNLSKPRETVKDMEAWCATVHGVAQSRTRLSEQEQGVPYLMVECISESKRRNE